MNSGNSNFTPSHCTTDVPTDTGVENKHERSPKLDITSDEDDDEYYSLGYDDITSADDTLSYTSAIDSTSDTEDTIYNENDASAIDTIDVDNEELTEGVVIEESALPSKHTIAEDLDTDLASATIMSEDKHKAANTFCKTDTTSAIHSHAPEGNVSFDENDTPAVDSSSTTSGAAVLNVDKSSSSDSENASLIAQDQPSSSASLLPTNDSASDQSFIDLGASSVEAVDQYLQSASVHIVTEKEDDEIHCKGDVDVRSPDNAIANVEAIDQYLQSASIHIVTEKEDDEIPCKGDVDVRSPDNATANVEDSSATRCLVEPPTSEVHGDVVVPAGITSYNKEVDDVGDTRNESDHHSLAADTGSQNDNVTSTTVDITKGATTLIEESLDTTDTAKHQMATDIKIGGATTPANVQSTHNVDDNDDVSSVASEDQTQCTTLLNDNDTQYGGLTVEDIDEGSVGIALDSTSAASNSKAATYAHAGVVSTPGDIVVVYTSLDTDITEDVDYEFTEVPTEVQSASGDESKITFGCTYQDDFDSSGEHVLSQISDAAIAHSDSARASADTSLNMTGGAVDAYTVDSAKPNGLVANAVLSDNESSARLQSKALSEGIVEMAAVLISPSVEEDVTKAESGAPCTTASIECLHTNVTSRQIEDYVTKLEAQSALRNDSSHSSGDKKKTKVSLHERQQRHRNLKSSKKTASQKYGGSGTCQVCLFVF